MVSPLVEECDSTFFCDNKTCKCLPNHPKNNITGRCSGCGNFAIDPGEDCDGSLYCNNETCKCIDGFSPSKFGCLEIPLDDHLDKLFKPLFFAALAFSITLVILCTSFLFLFQFVFRLLSVSYLL